MAFGQQASLEVRSQSPRLVATAPGRIVTASVVVANRGIEVDEILESLALPAGCQKVAPPDVPFRLPPRGQMVRVVAIAVPANMPAGRFPVRYLVQSRRDPSAIGSFDFKIHVTALDNLELVVEPHPAPVIAGDDYTVKLGVTNRGNCRIDAVLSQRSSMGFPVSSDTPSFSLEGGASRIIACRVRTDKRILRHTSHAVTFDVTATSDSGKSLTASQASVAEIIPLTTGKSDPYHHFPMQHRLIGMGTTGEEGGVQVEFSGDGTLDEAGRHRVDFMLRGPDAMTSSLFGERDEYGASYHCAHWDVDIGDRIYELSPLTERHSLGRGAGLTWHNTRTAIGAFYMTTRHRQYDIEELGAFARHDFTDRFNLQANFLRKWGGDPAFSRPLPQTLLTLSSHYHLGPQLDLNAEAGISRSDDGNIDFAYRTEAGGELFGFNYSVEWVHAGRDFHGYYHNTDTLYASVNRTITDQLRAHLSLNRYSGNLELNDILSTVVNRENSWEAGLAYDWTKETELSLACMHTERQDILAPAAYDFREDAARFGFSHDFGKFQLQGHFHLGSLDNAITGESSNFERISLTANWQPTARQSYSVFGSYGPSAFTGSTDQSFDAGVTAHWNLRDNLIASLSYGLNQYDGLIGSEQNQVLGSLRYQFKNKSSLSIVGRWSRASTQAVSSVATNIAAILVTYTVPFDVAVSRKRSIGMLQGRICDGSKGRAVGVPRVVLQVGDQFAVTDEAGAFQFPGLKPGLCELQVRQDSLGPHLAMTTPLPMKIKIRPADTTFVDLTVAPACSLTIVAKRYAPADGRMISTTREFREAGGQEGIVVEISNGRDVWRGQTDRLGEAAFDRLPGGQWNIRFAATELPAHHAIERPERTVTLRGGQPQVVDVRILPQQRTLRLLEQGTIR